MKRLLVATALLIPCGLGAYYFWSISTRTPPETVLRETFLLANRGHFEDAAKNLTAGAQRFYVDKLDLMRATWKAITRGGSITEVETSPASYSARDIASVRFQLHFEDRSVEDVDELLFLEDGSWKLLWGETVKRLAPQFDISSNSPQQVRYNLAAAEARLEQDYTKITRTRAAIRLPAGCKWSDKLRGFEDPTLGTAITGDDFPFTGRDEVVRRLSNVWKEPKSRLVKETEVAVGKYKGKLVEVDQINDKAVTWRLIVLVIGDDSKALHINGQVPMRQVPVNENVVKAVRKSLMSVQWEP